MKHLDGYNVVVTGKIDGFARNDVETLLRDAGANPMTKITNIIDFVIVAGLDNNTAANTVKLRTARNFKIPLIDAKNFRGLVNGDISPSQFQVRDPNNRNGTQPQPIPPKANANDFIAEAMAEFPSDYCI